MATVEKMTIALTAEQAGFVRSAVESGRYASTSEVIREAVREWKERRDPLAAYSREELRELVEAGIESGPGRFPSMGELKAEARRRLQIAQL
ncbi:MAG TPA: type II toxin-antitoxin system ParD family antitoxin [Rhizobiaceae bacterium]|nr:type II toxin-antitoxin system ParD family antitoxin [Rhizobiaceae bacterium]